MSTDRRFERDLPESLRDLYLGPSPDYRYDVLARTSRMRQRPAWMFPERWLPMAVVDRRRLFAPNVPWRAIGVLALIGLLLGTLAAPATSSAATGQVHAQTGHGVVSRPLDGVGDSPVVP